MRRIYPKGLKLTRRERAEWRRMDAEYVERAKREREEWVARQSHRPTTLRLREYTITETGAVQESVREFVRSGTDLGAFVDVGMAHGYAHQWELEGPHS